MRGVSLYRIFGAGIGAGIVSLGVVLHVASTHTVRELLQPDRLLAMTTGVLAFAQACFSFFLVTTLTPYAVTFGKIILYSYPPYVMESSPVLWVFLGLYIMGLVGAAGWWHLAETAFGPVASLTLLSPVTVRLARLTAESLASRPASWPGVARQFLAGAGHWIWYRWLSSRGAQLVAIWLVANVAATAYITVANLRSVRPLRLSQMRWKLVERRARSTRVTATPLSGPTPDLRSAEAGGAASRSPAGRGTASAGSCCSFGIVNEAACAGPNSGHLGPLDEGEDHLAASQPGQQHHQCGNMSCLGRLHGAARPLTAAEERLEEELDQLVEKANARTLEQVSPELLQMLAPKTGELFGSSTLATPRLSRSPGSLDEEYSEEELSESEEEEVAKETLSPSADARALSSIRRRAIRKARPFEATTMLDTLERDVLEGLSQAPLPGGLLHQWFSGLNWRSVLTGSWCFDPQPGVIKTKHILYWHGGADGGDRHFAGLPPDTTDPEMVAGRSWAEFLDPPAEEYAATAASRLVDSDFTMDILIPDHVDPTNLAAVAALPRVVNIHGGAWVIGDKSLASLPMTYALARAGFLVATCNYRLCPRAHSVVEMLRDCRRAMEFVRTGRAVSRFVERARRVHGSRAALLRMNPTRDWDHPLSGDLHPAGASFLEHRRVFLAGDSAGGHIALVLSLGQAHTATRVEHQRRLAEVGKVAGTRVAAAAAAAAAPAGPVADPVSGPRHKAAPGDLAPVADAEAVRAHLTNPRRDTDPRVAAVLDFFGVGDFLNEQQFIKHRQLTTLLEEYLLRRSPDGDPTSRRFSPHHMVQDMIADIRARQVARRTDGKPKPSAEAGRLPCTEEVWLPPQFGISGTRDTLVPSPMSVSLYKELKTLRLLRNELSLTDDMVRVSNAHHIFNYYESPRTAATNQAAIAFLRAQIALGHYY